ncbi:MAG TPA: NlpC/P60 family protein [Gaiellaceae bacterium]|nr:NlpC/P60 family protein [Gaiellaceae bacterium]
MRFALYVRHVIRRRITLLAVLGFACAAGTAGAASPDWAAAQIREVTKIGVLGTSPATFAPQAPLTQGQLASAVAAVDSVLHPPAPPAPKAAPIVVLSSIPASATVAGDLSWQVDAKNLALDRVDFAVDGVGVETQGAEPFVHQLDTTQLADGVHTLAVQVTAADGRTAVASWKVTVANAPGAVLTPLSGLATVPVVKRVAAPTATSAGVEQRAASGAAVLYHATAPAQPVTIKQLDAALVAYLGLAGAAREIQSTLQQARLNPPPQTGTEAVARMLDLRLNHPASQDFLELLPNQPATRAEAAYSFAQLLHLDATSVQAVQQAADTFTLPAFTPWQRTILTTAIHYVGYPYVWGGTSPTAEVDFGVQAPGGFDCSGFVWRVYKLTPYAGEGNLASVLRGRTTYQMSGEVPRSRRIPATKLQPADVMFFGANGPHSQPSVVDHTALYLGNGWFVQSSDEGVTLLPFSGWYTRTFAWARRPLHEAGLE